MRAHELITSQLEQFAAALDLLTKSHQPLLLSHEKPDGDALGSLIALRFMLKELGVDAAAMLFESLPHRYTILNRGEPFVQLCGSINDSPYKNCDAVVLLDTCTYSQLRPLADWLRAAKVPKLVFDHHQTRDELADCYVIDASAAATCLILFEFAKQIGWTLDRLALDALFVGIATDTGWFRHSNTDGRALAAAAELAARGVKPHELFEALYQHDSTGRVRLLGAAIESLEIHGGAVATMDLNTVAFSRCGASLSDTEDIVNEPLRIEPVVVSILFVEQPDGVTRINFRSKPPSSAVPGSVDIDVAAIAATFGGGGHRRAAGARSTLPFTQLKVQVIERVLAAITKVPRV